MEETKKGGFNPKVLLVGLPLFIVQLVVVYFVTANILLSKIQQPGDVPHEDSTEVAENDSTSKEKGENTEAGQFLYSMKDIIVNPAGTNGSRYLLVDLGIDFPSAEKLEEFKTKEILAKDVVISALSSKTLPQLNSIAYKDSLKSELLVKLEKDISKMEINSVYFSRFIIQ